MIFPYLRGMVFCAKLTNDGGWKAIDEAYRNPPLSTEQILHPEKYRAKPDPPTIDRPRQARSPARAGRSWAGTSWARCRLGVLLRRHGGKAAAAGWDGDRYAVFEGPDEKLGLVWLSTWDSEDDAREFAQAYARYQTRRWARIRSSPRRSPTRSGGAGTMSARSSSGEARTWP